MKKSKKSQIRLIKDISYGDSNLCTSLLDMTEFQDIDEIFQKKKINWKISQQNVQFTPYLPPTEEQAQYDMTPAQKIQQYKKRKIKERYNQSSIDYLKKTFKIRHSKIPNMLSLVSQSMKKQAQQIFDKQIQNSEKKLKFIRCQGKLANQPKKEFRSQMNKAQARYKFYSLKTGKPQMNQKLFPNFEEYVEGKNRIKMQEKFQFDILKIETKLNALTPSFDQNPESEPELIKQQIPIVNFGLKPNFAQSNLSSNQKTERAISSLRQQGEQTSFFKKKQKMHSSLQRYSDSFLQKSERSSRKIVQTMTNFFQTKNKKKTQYNNMVKYYDHDRPLTNQIRRKEYQFMKPLQKLKELKHYRNQSEQKRLKILSFNSSIYKAMLNMLGKYHEDDIPVNLQILRNLKRLMRRQYVFGEDDIREVLREAKKKIDHKAKVGIEEIQKSENKIQQFLIQSLLDLLNKAYGYRLFWIDL